MSLSMEKGGNILKLGNNLEKTVAQIQKDLPVGLDLSSFSNQPKVVKESIDEFVKSLAEAIIIVLIVSFISLGVRSGGCGRLVHSFDHYRCFYFHEDFRH